MTDPFDRATVRYGIAHMRAAAVPTSIRLTAKEKELMATAARKRGLSPTASIKRAALESVGAPTASPASSRPSSPQKRWNRRNHRR